MDSTFRGPEDGAAEYERMADLLRRLSVLRDMHAEQDGNCSRAPLCIGQDASMLMVREIKPGGLMTLVLAAIGEYSQLHTRVVELAGLLGRMQGERDDALAKLMDMDVELANAHGLVRDYEMQLASLSAELSLWEMSSDPE
jgi:hypothetical protein